MCASRAFISFVIWALFDNYIVVCDIFVSQQFIMRQVSIARGRLRDQCFRELGGLCPRSLTVFHSFVSSNGSAKTREDSPSEDNAGHVLEWIPNVIMFVLHLEKHRNSLKFSKQIKRCFYIAWSHLREATGQYSCSVFLAWNAHGMQKPWWCIAVLCVLPKANTITFFHAKHCHLCRISTLETECVFLWVVGRLSLVGADNEHNDNEPDRHIVTRYAI